MVQISFLNKLRQPENSNSGFTLLEVIIAMAIMAISFGSILAVEGGAINASTRAKQMSTVATLARNQMIETEYKIEGKKFDEVKKEEEGTFKEPYYQDYTWKTVIKEINFPNITSLMGGNPNSDNNSANSPNQYMEMMGKAVTKFLSKSLREVTVTIFWKKGGNQQSYSVSTYWVDLNNEFSISE